MAALVKFPQKHYINNRIQPPSGWSLYQFAEACSAYLNAHRAEKEPAVSVEDKAYLNAVHEWRKLWRPETVRSFLAQYLSEKEPQR